ncbi:adenosylcobinamide-phosphate synthase CbiB [Uliginosibacterium sp. 31-16]|uniref:adenosylcobinamide-phosphate synthase CbiB n=1 Tax=Uliginosibacterium sp. 31-16 TaxID=3068315 RepID=UPI00273E2277|nr:adenosylcobinamide-phosphate synthase CbiB [Uliginosibacterium sp. 31-16]MDP5239162.1 adenosylcobinamide-phosphate synthase CbiB [Uliginosibacterium sp. 31-16]
MTITLAILLGVLLDRLLGEVPRWHPLVGFGRSAAWLERRINKGSARILRGALGWTLLVAPLALGALLLAGLQHGWIVDGIALYFALGARALTEHGHDVAQALQHGDMEEARRRTGYLVSRETTRMNEEQIARATTESLLENGNDAIFGALFWCAVAGAPGVILYRLANTLDAMWGYRNARFNEFGRIAARVDDVLNFIPARLTALTYALLGEWRRALRSWRAQAAGWSSPNAGPVMAAGAGSLGLQLGGAAIYEGIVEERPLLGEGRPAEGRDIPRALTLISRSLLVWIAVMGLGDTLVHLF